MTTIKEILEAKPFPPFIKDHPIMKEFTEIKKVFPSIGLKNSSEKYSSVIRDEIATPLFQDMSRLLTKRSTNLSKFLEKKISDKRKENGKNIVDAMVKINSFLLNKSKELIKHQDNGKISLCLSETISFGDLTFKKGESLFRVYNKLGTSIKENKFAKLQELDNLQTFKNFSAENIPNDSKEIVFSSDGIEGAWDLATISMRGITSCQSWNGQYHNCLVGTILDPFVGVIYLTEKDKKFNDHGSKMIRRSMVRFIIDKVSKKPIIYIDHMYPQYDKSVSEAFIAFIKAKVNNKFEVKYLGDYYSGSRDPFNQNNYYIPSSPIIDRLRLYSRGLVNSEANHGLYPYPEEVDDRYNYGVLSYQDTFIKNNYKNKLKLKYLTNLKNKKENVRLSVDKMAKLAASSTKNKDIKPIITKFNRSKSFRSEIYNIISSNAEKLTENTFHKNSKEYMRDYCLYLSLRRELMASVSLSAFKDKFKELEIDIPDNSIKEFINLYMVGISSSVKTFLKDIIK